MAKAPAKKTAAKKAAAKEKTQKVAAEAEVKCFWLGPSLLCLMIGPYGASAKWLTVLHSPGFYYQHFSGTISINGKDCVPPDPV